MDQSQNTPLIGLIASKNPVPALEATVRSIFKGGASRVIVVDDGSDDPDSKAVFENVEKIGGEVLHLKRNVGKAKALRAGFWILPHDCIIVQTDDDTLSGDLVGPLNMIRSGKADMVDIRVEVVRTSSLLGLVQELDYWLINAVSKRVQDFFRARLWMSGASVMYSYDAGKVIILEIAYSITEDTEGLFRARGQGYRVRYYSKHKAQFLTMVPEDFKSVKKQWLRWTTGNGQVMSIYGFGGGVPRIAAVNIFAWLDTLLPIPIAIRFGLVSSATWGFAICFLFGVMGAIRLKRPQLALVGVFLPLITMFWTYMAFWGLFRSWNMARKGQKTQHAWESPKRTAVLEPVAV